ncbi:MAG: hypothetical protein EOP46_19095 [Sphingobacteriaceae bacterium]|nr:MAG: hypothetical protein EOP46_19095 [Sphingobacteriaceae bacterium]
MHKSLFLILFISVLTIAAKGQDAHTVAAKPAVDTAAIKKDIKKPPVPASKVAERRYHPDSAHSPRRAVMRSLMIPGWGQLYNKKWWKVPVIYTGIGLLGSAIVFNQRYYNQFVVLARYRQRGITPNPGDPYYREHNEFLQAPDSYINNAVDGYRRNRDLSILGVLGAWGIQMIDAYVDAKFIHSYTMDNDLSIKVSPGLIDQPMYAGAFNGPYIPGIKVTFAF